MCSTPSSTPPQHKLQAAELSVRLLPSLPGFMMPLGSSACFTHAIMSSTTGPCSPSKKPILPVPMPCSPVQVPPTAQAAVTTSSTTCNRHVPGYEGRQTQFNAIPMQHLWGSNFDRTCWSHWVLFFFNGCYCAQQWQSTTEGLSPSPPASHLLCLVQTRLVIWINQQNEVEVAVCTTYNKQQDWVERALM